MRMRVATLNGEARKAWFDARSARAVAGSAAGLEAIAALNEAGGQAASRRRRTARPRHPRPPRRAGRRPQPLVRGPGRLRGRRVGAPFRPTAVVQPRLVIAEQMRGEDQAVGGDARSAAGDERLAPGRSRQARTSARSMARAAEGAVGIVELGERQVPGAGDMAGRQRPGAGPPRCLRSAAGRARRAGAGRSRPGFRALVTIADSRFCRECGGRGCGSPLSVSRPSAIHFCRPPSRMATSPRAEMAEHEPAARRGAQRRIVIDDDRGRRGRCRAAPSPPPKSSAVGSMCGAGFDWSDSASISRKTAPGIWAARNSSRADCGRVAGMCQLESTMRRPGSPR